VTFLWCSRFAVVSSFSFLQCKLLCLFFSFVVPREDVLNFAFDTLHTFFDPFSAAFCCFIISLFCFWMHAPGSFFLTPELCFVCFLWGEDKVLLFRLINFSSDFFLTTSGYRKISLSGSAGLVVLKVTVLVLVLPLLSWSHHCVTIILCEKTRRMGLPGSENVSMIIHV